MFCSAVTNNHTHGVPNNVLEHGSDHNRFKDVPAFPEVTLHPVSQLMQPQQQQQQQPTSLLHGKFIININSIESFQYLYITYELPFSNFIIIRYFFH